MKKCVIQKDEKILKCIENLWIKQKRGVCMTIIEEFKSKLRLCVSNKYLVRPYYLVRKLFSFVVL